MQFQPDSPVRKKPAELSSQTRRRRPQHRGRRSVERCRPSHPAPRPSRPAVRTGGQLTARPAGPRPGRQQAAAAPIVRRGPAANRRLTDPPNKSAPAASPHSRRIAEGPIDTSPAAPPGPPGYQPLQAVHPPQCRPDEISTIDTSGGSAYTALVDYVEPLRHPPCRGIVGGLNPPAPAGGTSGSRPGVPDADQGKAQ
jgi:hypothetical protein